ncbi:hypothetical protein FDP08_07935 [Marinobacter panjinensis]|uniref:RiboL-PSP-HEPN domain-containing protein n=1 Tax=Marinobacter panjinensis TaxID=2576384 RepID=A0A4U6R3C5_9GAMM|nr:hypothetical protein [Marinobacter panjinensis]MCR8913295.1 hypothetical protein [Marinobacter panjinensis]TKV68029.1 hypothetical protein FDP08_07935 [Marinobacter panjinensis]
MKDIKLPLTQTVSITIDTQNLDYSNAVENEDGLLVVPLGTAMNSEISESMEKARANGGKVLYATTSIEQQLEGLLLRYFMGPFVKHDHRRDVFEREILQSSALSFSSKKELISKVVNHEDLLKGKKKNRLQSALKSIMGWRNAFAHGKVQHDNRKGCFVKYYSGGSKELNLTDEFWTELESVFKDCSELVNEASENLETKEPNQ